MAVVNTHIIIIIIYKIIYYNYIYIHRISVFTSRDMEERLDAEIEEIIVSGFFMRRRDYVSSELVQLKNCFTKKAYILW